MQLKRTKVVVTSLALSAALAVSGAPLVAYAVPSDAMQERVNEAYAELQSYTADLEYASGQLQLVRDELEELDAQIAETQEAIAQKKQQIAEGQAVIAERTSTSYKNGNADLLSVVLGASSFNELFSNIFYANKIADRDARVVEQVKTDMEELERQEQLLAEQKAEQEKLVADQEAKTAAVAERQRQQQAYYEGLDAELQQMLADEEAQRKAEEAAREEAEKNEAANNGPASPGSGSSNKPQKPSKPNNNTNTDNGNAPSSVVDYAKGKVGSPYIFGAGGPNAFDCSGLTSWSYAQVGVSIPHQSQSQYNLVAGKGHLVYDIANLSPGDLVFWGFGGSGSSIYHVGLYIGGGQYVHASMPGVGVVISSLSAGGNYVGGGSPV